ncbi:MAG: cell division protein FtsA [Lachnospiraceae bacterium]|nr:cell division protein FtsA [Lachnospiraceae bacterium]
MTELKKYPGQLVFGLDIGTRSIVGTVGYKTGDVFHVIAQEVKEHHTRAMLDGQIHDINMVGRTIREIKEVLEGQIGRNLTDVCIAAAGRVLRTVTTHIDYEFEEETTVDPEHIYSLDMMGVEKAYDEFHTGNDLELKFYCVGYTVVKYYLNKYPMTNLENHKAKIISADLIATFLPDEVVDGLYKAVGVAGLEVANLTLEPIAAIQVAIPVMYRMLNLALVDVGAGTSDISITRDGSIVAYGMIPAAGDEISEVIAKHCLVDFAQAEKIKLGAGRKGIILYKDIMGITQKMEPEEVANLVKPTVDQITKSIAKKIIELNGGKSVSAVFVVGGGGKITGFTQNLARELDISPERVALRGEEVLGEVDFQTEQVKKDSMFVTPIGICMNFYDQKNNFIFVQFNGERVKLYDKNNLTIVDAAMQAGFSNDGLFPKRGKELNFFINGKGRMVRGELGEAAVITLNGEPAGMNASIEANDKIVVIESTAGAPASVEINQLPEYDSSIQVIVNEQKVVLPKFAQVNGNLQSGYYDIKENDSIDMLNYYTVRQIAEFMDVILKEGMNIYVNNRIADLDTKVYENFSVIWTMEVLQLSQVETEPTSYEELPEDDGTYVKTIKEEEMGEEGKEERKKEIPHSFTVVVNGEPIRLTGKGEYMYVDVFDLIDFDLSNPKGSSVCTLLNGENAQYTELLKEGDVLEIFWKD